MSKNGFLSVTVKRADISQAVYDNMAEFVQIVDVVKPKIERINKDIFDLYQKEFDAYISDLQNSSHWGAYRGARPIYERAYVKELELYANAKDFILTNQSESITFDAEDWLKIELWRQGAMVAEMRETARFLNGEA